MKTRLLTLLFLPVIAFSGCQTTPEVSIVKPGDQGQVRTTGIDPQDFINVADELAQDLNAKGVLNKFQPRPSIVAVSTVINNTAQRFNTALLTDKIMAAIEAGGSARLMINRGVGADGKPRYEDRQGAGTAQRERFREDATSAPDPDFTLSGSVIETYSTDGKAKQYTYTIHLRLTAGEVVAWQGHTEFGKKTKAPGIFRP